jgi:hypothetical protein
MIWLKFIKRLFDILDMENIEYSEWVPAGALVKGLFAMVTLMLK